jgi:hypothetical protein
MQGPGKAGGDDPEASCNGKHFSGLDEASAILLEVHRFKLIDSGTVLAIALTYNAFAPGAHKVRKNRFMRQHSRVVPSGDRAES